jgi:pilus assembly protein Flp/PilA
MRIAKTLLRLFIYDKRGQDMIEYALMAAFLAVACAAVFPGISTGVSTLLAEVASVMSVAASQS